MYKRQFQGQAGVADIKAVTIDNKLVELTPTNHKGIYYLPVGDDLEVNAVSYTHLPVEKTINSSSGSDIEWIRLHSVE